MLSFRHCIDIFLHVLNIFTKIFSLCNHHAAERLKGRDSEISKDVVATSTRIGRLGPTAFLKGFSVYGHRDSGIGNPMKGNKPEVLETTSVYSSERR